tara:strand:- start:986 stop:1786 length:801 start_codon:yes stop_codon:yes gene_type:complete
MKKNFASVLVTNFNKGHYLEKTLRSCQNQNFKKKEILIFDDCSSDNSLEIIKKFKKKIKLIKNKKKKFKSGPLNQINGIIELFKKSKGEIIFLLDGDDIFKKDKISFIINFFKENRNVNFIQDVPSINKTKKFITYKKKLHIFSIWPKFYPTSTIVVRRKFFSNFLNHIEKTKFPNLEIDARISMFAFLQKEFLTLNKSFTRYNYDKDGITSKYKKFSFLWWIKRNEAFSYLVLLHKKLKIRFIYGIDFLLTRIVKFFLIYKFIIK